jgi:hypothetical protein
MGYTLDAFVAELRCPRCQRVSSANEATGMYTRIRSDPQLAWLGVGSALEIDPATVPDAGYFPVQPPGDTIRILQIWSCPNCDAYPNWAEIVVRDGHIESVTAVPLDRETLDRVHFIDEDVYLVADVLGDRKYPDITADEVVPLLRQLL